MARKMGGGEEGGRRKRQELLAEVPDQLENGSTEQQSHNYIFSSGWGEGQPGGGIFSKKGCKSGTIMKFTSPFFLSEKKENLLKNLRRKNECQERAVIEKPKTELNQLSTARSGEGNK